MTVLLGAVGPSTYWYLTRSTGGAALGTTAAFALFLVIWLPGGPLGHGWAQRSGTPTSLLAGSSRK